MEGIIINYNPFSYSAAFVAPLFRRLKYRYFDDIKSMVHFKFKIQNIDWIIGGIISMLI